MNLQRNQAVQFVRGADADQIAVSTETDAIRACGGIHTNDGSIGDEQGDGRRGAALDKEILREVIHHAVGVAKVGRDRRVAGDDGTQDCVLSQRAAEDIG